MQTTPRAEDRQDTLLNDFLDTDRAFYLLLDTLEIPEEEEDQFEDALYNALGTGVIKLSEFSILQRYLGDAGFLERFQSLLSAHANELESLGFPTSELAEVGEGIKHHVDMIISKFDIYNHLTSRDDFDEFYGVLCSSKYGDIIISKDGDKTYLLRDNCFYFCDRVLINEVGEVAHLLFYFPDHTIHLDFSEKTVWRIEGTPVGGFFTGSVNAIISIQGDDEILTILETQDNIKKSRIGIQEGRTQFLGLYALGKDGTNIVVQHIGKDIRIIGADQGLQNDVDEEENDEIPKIGFHVLHELYSVTDKETLFSTRGKIRDIISTQSEVFVVYEEDEYHPEARNTHYTRTGIGVYSASDYTTIIAGIPKTHRPEIIILDDNVLIINNKAEHKYIFSCRDRTLISYKQLGARTYYHKDGQRHINIEFEDEQGKNCYDSTDEGYHDDDRTLIVERNYN